MVVRPASRIQDAKLERARRFGAMDKINSSETDPVGVVLALADGGVNHTRQSRSSATRAYQQLPG